ncbi:hypothetical protein ILUMI_21745 [Ignelater luminosus]|uniref:Uncharacterized protein n=1 Tax=Ignelater luminosus TaxID=2038154 RepID=A0A8K0CF32_IGNLU|nr:hypothetical protein ILUMI_21745 [Ignelater luminosus]
MRIAEKKAAPAEAMMMHRKMGHSLKYPISEICKVYLKSKQTRPSFHKIPEKVKTKEGIGDGFDRHLTLSSEDKTLEIEEKLENISWGIMGLCEVRQKGEGWKTLKSGHALYHYGEQD